MNWFKTEHKKTTLVVFIQWSQLHSNTAFGMKLVCVQPINHWIKLFYVSLVHIHKQPNIFLVRTFNEFTPLAHVWVTPTGWQEVVRAIENSSYFKSLEAKAKERCCEKLSCVKVYLSKTTLICRQTMQDSSSDMSTWPRILFGNIFGYFISWPGVYTEEQLLSWNQWDAFYYYQPSLTLLFFNLLQHIYVLCVDKDGWYIVNMTFQIYWLA